MLKTLPLFLVASALVAAEPNSIQQQYHETAQKLIDAALQDTEGLDRLQYLCDRIGNRLSGSASLERAIEWAAGEMKKAGLENVQTPPVKVPHWIRGNESATLLSPVVKPLNMLGLGMSVSTPKDGITADVVAASDFEELAALGRTKVAGRRDARPRPPAGSPAREGETRFGLDFHWLFSRFCNERMRASGSQLSGPRLSLMRM